MPLMSVRGRLLLVNFFVLVVGILTSTATAYTYKLTHFSDDASEDTESLISTNLQGTLVAISTGSLLTGGLSLWCTRSIVRPLKAIERSVRRFNEGDYSVRVPDSSIPEIQHLNLTLNNVASHLQGLEERRHTLISDLAHELSAPLTVLRANLEMLEFSAAELTPDLQQQLLRETERMTRLLQDLKALSSIEDGSLPLHCAPFAPADVLYGAARMIGSQSSRVAFHLNIPEPLPLVFADADRVQQILLNLLTNAFRYTPQGSVSLSVWNDERDLWVSVTDTGIGIAPQDMTRIFDRFYRADTARQLHRNGSGIGLAVTQRLIQLMGGQLQVESEVGQGSTFRFSLPLTQMELVN